MVYNDICKCCKNNLNLKEPWRYYVYLTLFTEVTQLGNPSLSCRPLQISKYTQTGFKILKKQQQQNKITKYISNYLFD